MGSRGCLWTTLPRRAQRRVLGGGCAAGRVQGGGDPRRSWVARGPGRGGISGLGAGALTSTVLSPDARASHGTRMTAPEVLAHQYGGKPWKHFPGDVGPAGRSGRRSAVAFPARGPRAALLPCLLPRVFFPFC